MKHVFHLFYLLLAVRLSVCTVSAHAPEIRHEVRSGDGLRGELFCEVRPEAGLLAEPRPETVRHAEAEAGVLYDEAGKVPSGEPQTVRCAAGGLSEEVSEAVRNVVLMIGDGMGLGQVAALMIENGYEPLALERAPYTAVCKTYSANNRVTDSAAAATAMATGRKTANGRIGMTAEGAVAENIVELAEKSGLATGIVVTTALYDATPAGFTAHVMNRQEKRRIACMMADCGLDVAVGSGRMLFGGQDDGRDPLSEMRSRGYTYAPTPEAFYAADRMPVIALFDMSYMESDTRREDRMLARATEHALELLARNEKGFFALIEGSQIDWGCHGNDMAKILAEMRDFDRAVGRAFDFADAHPGTLVIVVADHETGGLTAISNNRDFTASESGISYRFSTTSHSGSPVILYAYGAGASRFSGVMENTAVFHRVKALLLDGRD